MRKSILTVGLGVILLIAFIIFIFSRFFPEKFIDYSDWKTIDIENCGSINIPNDWVCYEKNNYIYITDKDSNPIMIQTYSDAGYEDNPGYKQGEEESNMFFKKVKGIKTISSAVLSNGAYYGKMLILKDDKEYENYYLEIGYNRTILFIVWDDTLDLKLLKKIAVSFVSIPID